MFFFSIFLSPFLLCFLFFAVFEFIIFFRSLDYEILVPMASDVEAVGRHGYNMILRWFCKRGKVEIDMSSHSLSLRKQRVFLDGSIEVSEVS